jgi:negative regulator of sigma E activity
MMANESNPDRSLAGPSTPGERPGTGPEQRLAASLPVYETEQPDPGQLSAGRMGVGSITVAAVAAAVILGVVLYGLNSAAPAAPAQTASSAPTAGGGATHPAPQAGKNGHS